jgi:hypothetical protein
VERAAAERELWFQVARESWDAYEQHQPHHLPGLSQIAQLLDLASQLGRLATGLETQHQPDPDPIEPHLSFQAMLERIYGSGEMTVSPTTSGVTTV